VREYYHRRAPEYDDWYAGKNYADPAQRASFLAELEQVVAVLQKLPAAHTLDVACGTGFLTRHLPGEIVGLDQSSAMIEIARKQAPNASYVTGDAFALPYPGESFERVFTGHFYGHLEPADRDAFLAEARRVAPELVVADAARRPGHEPDEWQRRPISDGTTYPVFKRFFLPEQLVHELGGGDVLFAGAWFVVVAA
jgi:demethylmenaquinone methyltransferase/2-methoxy-6-polyprenyl-1,4-benzoquinol methylase